MTRVEPRALPVIRWAATVLAPGFAGAVAVAAFDLWPARWSYSIGGHPVSRDAWLETAAPIFLLAAAWMTALAVGLWRRRRWARYMAPGLFLSVAAGAGLSGLGGRFPPSVILRAILETGTFAGLSAWYFFWKPSVVGYFARQD